MFDDYDPVENYKTILKRDSLDGYQALENKYNLNKLSGEMVVVKDNLGGLYLVFHTRNEFWDHYLSLPNGHRCYDKVIFGHRPQHPKLDIDIDDIPRGEDQQVVSIMRTIIDAFEQEFYDSYNIYPHRKSFTLLDSSGFSRSKGKWKYSFHLHLTAHAFCNYIEARNFRSRLLSRLPQHLHKYVDDVNKRIQSFRLYGSSKLGETRPFVLSPYSSQLGTNDVIEFYDALLVTAHPLWNSIVGNASIAGASTPPIFSPASEDCQETLIDHAISLANDLHATYGFSLHDVKFPFANFDRTFPTHCTICNETHHRNNSLYLLLKQRSETLWAVEERCHQDSKRNHRTLGYLTVGNNTISHSYEYPVDAVSPISANNGQPLSQGPSSGTFSRQDRLGKRINGIHNGTVDPKLSVDTSADCLLSSASIIKYSSDSMEDYELVPTLLVRGNMGLGKTKTLRRYLDNYFPRNATREPVIRFVTFRQTFSQSLQQLFPDFTSYKDIALGGICQADFPRVIVQVESLHRIIIPSEHKPIDVLVLDEVESTLAQFSSGLHKHFSSAFAAFKWMLSTARHVVCMDANLGARTIKTLRRMRALPMLLHWNVFSQAKEDQFYFTTNMGDWIESLL
ncbi:uncharacterized protein OCT59_012826 [Rhizophagus irregularis]|uniref:Uncharacterized protein n=1 Tax=Rhizophagus irregularis (strain DAOM 197198w) TaxID=1432141 RepID=A0A015JNQ3_RHIIW|nr:hypothetical protein RirG_101430 [Rhizophagus irregularis DAOM 197198w]EXX68841.1 hypothetical protein RirG_101440 [Rhizophagus irregularis DAOM 197198w]UZO20402.1 hypothetical protein OCT59_012826 [Rhizophagus irregularis]GET61778.1 putative helicase [Rhizophagus irregularis DAOM 181602=DAOM 197198]